MRGSPGPFGVAAAIGLAEARAAAESGVRGSPPASARAARTVIIAAAPPAGARSAVEKASKSASTGTSRTAAVDTGNPVVLGRTITQDGLPVLSSSVDANQSFEGAGSSSQSNQLLGDITVTVADVLANGNLVVRGEKWLTLNQGEEYIQVSGIVRPSDIRPDNSVESLRLADARIAYSGQGHVANSNRPGWLSRFFTSVIWPF